MIKFILFDQNSRSRYLASFLVLHEYILAKLNWNSNGQQNRGSVGLIPAPINQPRIFNHILSKSFTYQQICMRFFPAYAMITWNSFL